MIIDLVLLLIVGIPIGFLFAIVRHVKLQPDLSAYRPLKQPTNPDEWRAMVEIDRDCDITDPDLVTPLPGDEGEWRGLVGAPELPKNTPKLLREVARLWPGHTHVGSTPDVGYVTREYYGQKPMTAIGRTDATWHAR